MRTIIADDEAAARRKLRHMLSAYDNIEIIAEAEDGENALELIAQHQPDIAFLDIEMPELSGMEVARQLTEKNIRLVFVTAYDHYAVQAFETEAVDYLLKPVSAKRLAQCLERIAHPHRGAKAVENKDQQATAANKPADQLAIRHGSAVRLVNVDHIVWLESIQGYCRVQLNEAGQSVHKQDSLITDTSLAQTEELLPAQQFLRISRSTIVNTDFVVRHWTEKRQMFVTLSDFADKPLAVSRRNASIVRRRWQ